MDQLFDGRRLPATTLVDNRTRESLAPHVGQRIRGIEVVAVLERIAGQNRLPKRIQVDSGPEFVSKDLDHRVNWNHVELDFSRPGKPTDNALIEAINSRFSQECLSEHWFMSLPDAQDKIDVWRHDCNQDRPHSAFGYRPQPEFVAESQYREAKVA